MSFRFMRILLFFDLPTITSENQRSYRKFVKDLKRDGFYMLQESVYVKMAINKQVADGTIKKVKNFIPKEGNIMTLIITENQFSSMMILLGESNSDIINDIDRVITL